MFLDQTVQSLARVLALLGGMVLLAIVVLTCVSITGRALISVGLGPVPGDFELVEAGASFAVFAFLPWCQVNRGHAAVDIFTNILPAPVNRLIDLVAETLMAIAFVVITWKLWDGMAAKLRYGDTTFILQFPLWWAYAASLVAALVASAIAVYMIGVRLRELRAGKSIFNQASGAVH